MLESLRARLLLWYSLILVLLVAIYATTVTSVYRQSLIDTVDGELSAIADVIVRAVNPDVEGTFDLNFPAGFREATFGAGDTGRYYAVWDGRGVLVDQSGFADLQRSMPPPGQATTANGREVVVDAPGPARIVVGQRLDSVNDAVRALALTVTGAGALVLLLSLAGGWFLAGRALAPIARINRTAGAMIGGDLTARIPVKDTDSELEQVARALNGAFDRMATAADLQRQFTADASHEFRTPLATLRAEFDWALKRPRSSDEYRQSIEKGTKAVARMTDIAGRLLVLLRSDSSTSGDSGRTTLDAATVMSAALDLITPLAATHGVSVHTDIQPCEIVADRSLLLDAFSNLIKNAIEYNRPGGEVFVTMTPAGRDVLVTIRDTGVGIDARDLPHVFERFYRADRARSREGGGAGLGLAIVKQVVENHGGQIACTSTPGEGTEFSIRLPRAPSADQRRNSSNT